MKLTDVLMTATIAIAILLALACFAADEITVTTLLKVDNGLIELQKQVQNLKVDQTGKNASYGIIDVVSTATNTLDIGSDVGTGGYAFFRNVGNQTNNVTVTINILLKDGDVALFRVSGTNITATGSTTNTTELEYWVLEE